MNGGVMMNCLTHAHIVNKIYKRLEEELDFCLCKNDLLWGSIRPDIFRGSIPHIKNENVNRFYDKLNGVCMLDPFEDLGYFSKELGEIFHYICDYFCYAHNQPQLQNDLWDHIKYEYRLHNVAKKFDYSCIRVEYSNYDNLSLFEVIEYKHSLYLKCPHFYKHDIINSFQVSLLIGKKILMESSVINEGNLDRVI